MSRLPDARAFVAASLALALAACVIGPKPDDPLSGGDGTGSLDAGGDTREIADIGAVPNPDSGLVLDAPTSGGGDSAADAGDAADAADAPEADAPVDDADAAPSDGDAELAADGATDGGPG